MKLADLNHLETISEDHKVLGGWKYSELDPWSYFSALSSFYFEPMNFEPKNDKPSPSDNSTDTPMVKTQLGGGTYQLEDGAIVIYSFTSATLIKE